MIFFIGIWLVTWGAIIITIGYGLSNNPKKADTLLFSVFILLLLFGLLAIDILLWLVRGKESIEITNDNFIIKRMGSLLKLKRSYPIREINGFSVSDGNNVSFWAKSYGLAGGQIRFDVKGKTKFIGQTLTKAEAQEYVNELNALLSSRKQK